MRVVPTYEYRCLECDERFERRCASAEADLAHCSEGHRRVKRLLSMFTAARSGPEPVVAGGCCGGACGCG
jgi:putative FmdB family regulatory protein